jgi:dienelactone hydrolase
MSTSFSESGGIPVSDATPVTSYSSVVLDMPNRPLPLEVKVSAPSTGTALPVVLLSHGHGGTNFLASSHGYGPLADFLAAHGFVVIQPTHLNAMFLGLRESDHPEAPMFWRMRPQEMSFIIDELEEIEKAVPGLAGRIDRERIGAVGHSLGGHTVAMLLGMQVDDPNDPREKDLSESRIKAGVVIAAPGIADEHLSEWASGLPSLRYADFGAMAGAALVIAGDEDLNLRFSDRLSYRWDAFTQSPPGNKTLLTFFGAEHIFGGISGYDAVETTDEEPERVATLRALVWAYLRRQLYPGDAAWDEAVAALAAADEPLAKVEEK